MRCPRCCHMRFVDPGLLLLAQWCPQPSMLMPSADIPPCFAPRTRRHFRRTSNLDDQSGLGLSRCLCRSWSPFVTSHCTPERCQLRSEPASNHNSSVARDNQHQTACLRRRMSRLLERRHICRRRQRGFRLRVLVLKKRTRINPRWEKHWSGSPNTQKTQCFWPSFKNTKNTIHR